MQPPGPQQASSEAYEKAVALHKQHQFDSAAELYRAHLAAAPEDAAAHAQLAACLLQAGGAKAYAEAAQLARRAVQLQPSCGRLRHTLGRLHEKAAPPRWREAAECYERACEKDPQNVQFLLDLARALKELDRPARAAEAYARAAALAPSHPRAHFRLGMTLRRLGRRAAAAEAFRRHLEIDPSHTAAQFWLAALTGDAAAAAACPPEMVAGLFDEYADKFDEHLVGELGYRTPELLRDLLLSTAAADAPTTSGAAPALHWRSATDLGCGTGLMGPLLRASCDQLVGVDLSAGMCDKARARGCYEGVEVGELVSWLRGQVEGQQQQQWGPFDLLVAADVLVYIGDLVPLFEAAAAAAPERGALFALSTERLDEAGSVSGGGDTEEDDAAAARDGGGGVRGYTLQATGRYAHSEAYLCAVAAATGWAVAGLQPAVIRYNAGKPIHGNLAVLRRL